MPNSRQTSVIASPSTSWPINRRRSSMTEHSFHGIHTSRPKAKSVTHVSGTKCHLCLRPLKTSRANRTAFTRPPYPELGSVRKGGCRISTLPALWPDFQKQPFGIYNDGRMYEWSDERGRGYTAYVAASLLARWSRSTDGLFSHKTLEHPWSLRPQPRRQ